jgi:hypothetical protein
MATSFRIVRNRNHTSKNDQLIRHIEGVYQWLDVAIDRAFYFRFTYPEDGSIRLYDHDATDEEIKNDPFGYEAVGSIIEVG